MLPILEPMKPLLIIFFFMMSLCSIGQTFNDINSSLMAFISSNRSNDSINFWIGNILSHRDTVYLKSQIDASSDQEIKMIEVFDSVSKKYGIKEVYTNNNKVERIFKDQKQDTVYLLGEQLQYEYFRDSIARIKSSVFYFPPNTVEAPCGCGTIKLKIRKQCWEEARKKAKKEGICSEHFARLITYINRKNGHINFILEIPVAGQRKVEYGFSVTKRSWYE